MTQAETSLEQLSQLPRAAQLIPWKVVELSVYPWGREWSPFNPSIHYDPAENRWRCVIRCANYSLPNGVPVLSKEARAGRARTRNVMLDLAPDSLAPIGMSEIREDQELAIAKGCTSLGLEDLRLFRTEHDGLIAVCCVLQHNLSNAGRPEIAICRFRWEGDRVTIHNVAPIRGDWSQQSQKNWTPFDGTQDIALLYSIDRSIVMTEAGPATWSPWPNAPREPRAAERYPRQASRVVSEVKAFARTIQVATPVNRMTRACTFKDGLRGGSQLVCVAPDRWIGVAHQMTFSRANHKKFYWHTIYEVDDTGRLVATSEPLRLSGDHGIEFAAGLAVAPDGRAVISYGTDDHQAWAATTHIEALLGLLRPVHPDRGGLTNKSPTHERYATEESL